MGIRQSLLKLYWRTERVIAPSLKYADCIYEEALRSNINPGARWLDVGAGHNVLSRWRFKQEQQLVRQSKITVGLDSCLAALRKHKSILLKVQGHVVSLPFKDCSFDLVTANMVVEHLDRPDVEFGEVSRVLKPGGLFIFHTPNGPGYQTVMARLIPRKLKKKLISLCEGRKEEDVFDTYYRANRQTEIRELAKSTGFEIIGIEMANSPAELAVIPPLAILEVFFAKGSDDR